MATHEWYVDSTVALNGDGTLGSPFKSLALAAEVISQIGGSQINYVHLKKNSVFYETVPHALNNKAWVGMYLDAYGEGEMPIVDATIDCTDKLEYETEHDWYTAVLGTHDYGDKDGKLTIGAIFRNGEPMQFRIYTDDHAKLRASLEGGGYSYNWIDGKAFVVEPPETQMVAVSAIGTQKGKPEEPPGHNKPPKPDKPGKPTEPPAPEPPPIEPPVEPPAPEPPPIEPPVEPPAPEPAPTPPPIEPPGEITPRYRVAVHSKIMGFGAPGPFDADDPDLNWQIKGIKFIGAKRYAIELASSKALIEGNVFFGMGGQRFGDAPENYLGNGIEVCVHADDVTIIGNTFDQIFDSAVTPQVYGDGQYATNVTVQGNFFGRCGLACVEISNQAGSDARVEHINVIGNHLKSNHGCFAPDIYGGRYAGVTIIFNVKTGVINHITVKDNDIEDMIHNAMTITECGDDVLVDNNVMRRCETSVFFGPNAGNPTKVVFTRNTSEDSKTHLRVKGDQASAIFQAKDNVFKGGEVAVSDGSSAPVHIELIDNTLNAAKAIVATRTENITGSGNVTTGEVDPKFEFLFNP